MPDCSDPHKKKRQKTNRKKRQQKIESRRTGDGDDSARNRKWALVKKKVQGCWSRCTIGNQFLLKIDFRLIGATGVAGEVGVMCPSGFVFAE